MSMSKKDYEAIAEIINQLPFSIRRGEWYSSDLPERTEVFLPMVKNLADYFMRQNPKFDPHKFFCACGYRKNLLE